MVFLCKKCNQTFADIFEYKQHIISHSEQASNVSSSSLSKTTTTTSPPNVPTNKVLNSSAQTQQSKQYIPQHAMAMQNSYPQREYVHEPPSSLTSPPYHQHSNYSTGVREAVHQSSSSTPSITTVRTSPSVVYSESNLGSHRSESTQSNISGSSKSSSELRSPSPQHLLPSYDSRMYSNHQPFYPPHHHYQYAPQQPYYGHIPNSFNPSVIPTTYHPQYSQDQEIDHLCKNFDTGVNLGSRPYMNNMESMRSKWYCPICDVECNSQQKLNEHLQGKTHLKKLKNQHLISGHISPPNVNEEKPSSSASTPTAFSSLSDLKDIIEFHKRQTGDWFKCKICDVECNGPDVLMNHLGGKQHKKNQERYDLKSKLFHTESAQSNMDPQQRTTRDHEHTTSNDTDSSLETITEMINSGKLIKKDEGSEEGFFCAVCETFCNSLDALKDHLSGKKHLKNMKNAAALELREKSLKLQTPASLNQQLPQMEVYQVKGITNDRYADFDISRGVQILEYFFTKVYFQKPSYIEISEGPPHAMIFKCIIKMESHNFVVEGIASSKKDAKRYAAIETCRVLNQKGLLKEVVPDYLYYNPLSFPSNK
ncbi:hypothetical protein C9374_011586 [Naegleria lovaniensis]|uniref:C2H2-type domain-containing protein n=1 Tax=Naegleria lovaniensis TaxID=51637 RepID=A0AA88GGZ1_NAELO|nr:uncharacterized protein C9374_011586 [Naegleria lovaniensis]KAG2373921.1 hypothetical protein C9374_011586 [Naegleria lovaniensis]